MTSHSSRTAPIPSHGPIRPDFDSQSDVSVPTGNQITRSISPEDFNKLKYKIDLDKQVAEKKDRLAQQWQTKIERDKQYVRNQPFGRRDHQPVLHPRELEEILTKGRAPSPVIDMPQQLPLQVRTNYGPNATNTFSPSTPMSQPASLKETTPSMRNNNNPSNFQRFYGPHSNSMTSISSSQTQSTGATVQPIKGDAHDPFILYDPNKEGQNVFNIIPQQDLYDPWGRPGGGAPLIHHPTGQKFTRYSGSLQDKLNSIGPLGFRGRQHNGRIDEQKRDLEAEQRRRFQEEMEHRSNAGDTAEWISHLESSRYPLKLHLPTTETTRQYIGAHDRARYEDSRVLHNDLVRQAEERARNQKISRYQDNIAELNHTEAQNSWWGRGGGGAPSITNRRHNVFNSFEAPRQRWTTNHLGQLTVADDQGNSGQMEPYVGDFYYPKVKGFSSHRNQYQMPEDQLI